MAYSYILIFHLFPNSIFFYLQISSRRSHNMLKHLQTLMRCSSDKIAAASQTHKTPSTSSSSSITDDDTITPCSGRGDCLNGTCLCEIRYSGDECDNYNLPYHASKFNSIYAQHKNDH